MIKCWISGFFLAVLINSASCGGRCYMLSQTECQLPWTNLWVANMEKQYTKICQYFGDVHKCTTGYMSRCQFLPKEKELYETDIVQVYTKKPYSCGLIGGNIMYKGTYNSSSVNKSPLYLFLFSYVLIKHLY